MTKLRRILEEIPVPAVKLSKSENLQHGPSFTSNTGDFASIEFRPVRVHLLVVSNILIKHRFDSGRRLPPAPRIQSFYNRLPESGLPPHVSESQPDQPLWDRVLSSHPRPIDDETSSIYPGYNTPALPLYVKDESPPPLPPVPSYADSQLVNGEISPFSPSIYETHVSDVAPLGNIVEEEPETVSSLHVPDRTVSPYQLSEITQGSECIQSRMTVSYSTFPERPPDQHSISELSYVDDPPRPTVESIRDSLSASPTPSSKALSATNNRRSNPYITLPYSQTTSEPDEYLAPGPSNLTRRITEVLRDIRGPLELHYGIEDDCLSLDNGSEPDDGFINFTFLSNTAVQLRDKVPRSTHIKAGIPYPNTFTGKDIVVWYNLCLAKSND